VIYVFERSSSTPAKLILVKKVIFSIDSQNVKGKFPFVYSLNLIRLFGRDKFVQHERLQSISVNYY